MKQRANNAKASKEDIVHLANGNAKKGEDSKEYGSLNVVNVLISIGLHCAFIYSVIYFIQNKFQIHFNTLGLTVILCFVTLFSLSAGQYNRRIIGSTYSHCSLKDIIDFTPMRHLRPSSHFAYLYCYLVPVLMLGLCYHGKII